MKENTKKIISDLINRFHRNKEIYKNPKYNETQLRREFLDPFFSALGWDVANKQGFAEQYKEVVHEDAIKISGATKAPDYSFRIGGVRKFFVEAKKPAVDIKYDIHPSYQLRRYAWSAKLPISILTDFEEFSVYDCRIKPNQKDNASVARIYYQTYDKYLQNLDFIYNTFSKESILKGSFDKYISTATKKRGTSEVDKEFLKEIERWRDTLARNIALRNKKLSIFEINFVVQLTIDRIIFLRIAEDRGIENYRTLYKLAEKKDIYKNLFHLFKIADDKYNSGIFDFQKDKISSTINIDDKVLKSILLYLYYPESPYEFSVLPADILGNIYEQFLGKTIRLTPSHQAKVEEKPEVRKAGGVYYTPKYIVDYIVKNTVGEKVKGKTPRQISKITICDPACGSGSFLIQAYQYLLNYHLEFYQKDIKKYKDKIIQISEDSYQLTTQEKKRILLNNIYGVDIDPQAVEVTKLSLLLKVLEGENKETLGKTLQLFHERALPNLSNNIKCGNSLIGTDYYDNVDMSLFGNEEMRKINAFDWEKEFPQIFHRGDAKHTEKYNKNKKLSDSALNTGFDVVIGNPPYVNYYSRQSKFLDIDIRNYYRKDYFVVENIRSRINTQQLFTEKGVRLLKSKGLLSFIIDKTLITEKANTSIRKYILNNTKILEILPNLKNVFAATVDVIILILRKEKTNNYKFKVILSESLNEKINCTNIPICNIFKQKNLEFKIDLLTSKINFYKIFEGCKKIKEIALLKSGANIGGHKELFISKIKYNDLYKPVLKGSKNVKRYYINYNEPCYLRYDHKLQYKINEKAKQLVGTKKKVNLVKLGDGHIDGRFEKPKLIIRQSANKLIVSHDENKFYCLYGLFILNQIDKEINLKYIMALLNSKLYSYYAHISGIIISGHKKQPQIRAAGLKDLPIKIISNKKQKAFVSLVDQMLSAQKQYHSAKIERDKKLYKQKIDILDRKIDKLVYELYDLTEGEIRIVEGRKNTHP